jgi:hypothetical protein
MIEEIEQLKQNMFSSDLDLVKSSAYKLGEIGGMDITDFMISLLDADNSAIRDYAALALEMIGDNKAVEPLFKSIFKNPNYNGTMAFALESLDCSNHLKSVFRILFAESYEAKISAASILETQTFDFSPQDLLEIKAMWDDCKLHPEKCLEIDDDDVKKDIQQLLDRFLNSLIQPAQMS